jgi:hypothetical protein
MQTEDVWEESRGYLRISGPKRKEITMMVKNV